MAVLPLVLLVALAGATNTTAGCGDGLVRGVNLGGWLVLEPWITPKLFQQVNVWENLDRILDEWTYAEHLEREVYMARMVDHWSTFVAEEDFEALAATGVSHVRVPVAYWYWAVFPGEPFPAPNPDTSDPTSPLHYLLRALGWMEKYGLQASMDLHTGPGSQNGYDNSGRRGEIRWVGEDYPAHRDNIERTLLVLDLMCGTLSTWMAEGLLSPSTLYGVGILNEPHICGPWYDEPKYGPACMDDFYPAAYSLVRQHFPAGVKVVVDVAAKGFPAFNDYMAEHREDVDLDAHHYQCFGASNQWSELPDGWSRHLEEACRMREDVESSHLHTWAGEFSLAVTDCQEYLQGGYATPYVPSQSSPETCGYYNADFSSASPEYRRFLADYFLAQIDSFESGPAGIGWTFWTMKTEDRCAPEWDFLHLVEEGILPTDLCTRPRYCS